MAITKTIEIDVIAPNAQQNISAISTSLDKASQSSENLNKTLNSDKGTGKLSGLKDAVGGLIPGFDKASNASSAFNKQLLLLLANPIGLVIAGIVLAVTGLVAIFRTFQPVVDKVEQGLAALSAVATTIKNTFIAVVTGTKSLGDAFSSLGSDISDTASRTMDLVKAQQDLEDVLAQQEVQSSRTRAEINKLNVQAKNRALSEEERLKLLEKAGKLEQQDFNQRVKNANEEVRIAREAIAIKAGFSKAEIKILKETGLATKELAESKGGNFDEEFKALANAQKARIGLEDESTANLEKNQNKRDALEDSRKAKEEAAETKRKERIEKAKTNAKKEEEDRKANQDSLLKELEDLVDYEDEAQKRKEERNKINSELDAKRIAEEDAQFLKLQELTLAKDDFEKLQLVQKYEAELILAKDNAELQLALKDKLTTDIKAIDDKSVEEQKANEQALFNAKLDFAGQGLALVSEIAGKGSKIGKAIAIAETIRSGIQGVQNAYTTAQKSPITIGFPAYPFVQAGLAGAFSALQLAKIKSSSDTGGSAPSGGGGGGGGGTATATPQFNLVGQSSTNQLAQTISSQQKQPIKTYVVAGDVTTQQSLDRNAVQTSTFGG